MQGITHENKFGMFIHWGIYSVLGLHEQVLARYNMDHSEYEKLIDRFNPVDYDPEKWVLLAKSAGMKYICFTAKHHDGFCMWDTKTTDYCITNTPYGRDVLKMLADACKKHDMLLSVYYSNPDWHHPDAYNSASTHQWKAKRTEGGDLEKYKEYIKAQITELLTGYGDLYTFFWDIPARIDDESMNALIRKLQPHIYINDRGWGDGDFSTPEREYEAEANSRFTRMTEACNSVGRQSWGYRENENFYSKKHICSAIDRYMALGGSYLLNVGPDSHGVITEKYEKRIMKIGDFYNRMCGCLECAEEDTYDYGIKDGDLIKTKKNGKTYLHFYNGLISDCVAMSNYPGVPKSVRLMNTGESMKFDRLYLPEHFDSVDQSCFGKKCLCIYDIDVDALTDEPIVIEIEW